MKYRKDANGRTRRTIVMYHNDGSLVIVPLWNESPLTREKYRGRLAKFLDFIGLTEGTMEERVTVFTEKGKKDSDWVFVSVLRFAQSQKVRVESGQISPATLRNYIHAFTILENRERDFFCKNPKYYAYEVLALSPIMAIITSTAAERIADQILSTYDGKILSISILDTKGNFLATKSAKSFEKRFGALREGREYGGTLAIAALSIVNEVREVAGEAKAITTTYEKCKMMLIPIPAYGILVGFVLERRVVLDEDRIANYIEGLVADNAATTGNAANTTRDATTT